MISEGNRGAVAGKANIVGSFTGIFRLKVCSIFIASPVPVVAVGRLCLYNHELPIVGDGAVLNGKVDRLIVGIILRVFSGGAVTVHSIFSDVTQGVLIVQVAFFIL